MLLVNIQNLAFCRMIRVPELHDNGRHLRNSHSCGKDRCFPRFSLCDLPLICIHYPTDFPGTIAAYSTIPSEQGQEDLPQPAPSVTKSLSDFTLGEQY